jgi:hypothetical protein
LCEIGSFFVSKLVRRSKVGGAEGTGNKGDKGVSGNGNSGNSSPDGSANETNSRGGCSMAEEADTGAGLADAGVELLLELAEAASHVVEIVGIGGRERVVEVVELEEEVEGAIALGLGEKGRVGLRVRVERKDVKEGVERVVEEACTVNAVVEEEAEMGGVLAVVEVIFDKSSEGVGLGVAKGVFNAFSVGLKHLRQY